MVAASCICGWLLGKVTSAHWSRFGVQVTDKLVNGHSNEGLKIIGATSQKSPPPTVARMVLQPEA